MPSGCSRRARSDRRGTAVCARLALTDHWIRPFSPNSNDTLLIRARACNSRTPATPMRKIARGRAEAGAVMKRSRSLVREIAGATEGMDEVCMYVLPTGWLSLLLGECLG